MRRAPFLIAAIVAVAAAQERSDPWRELLEPARLEPRALALGPDRWRGGGQGTLPLFERCWDDPFAVEPASRETARALLDAAPRGLEALVATAARIASIACVAPVVTERSPDLAAAIERVERRAGTPPDEARRRDLVARVASVPSSIAARATVVLDAVPDAVDAVRASLARALPKLPERERSRVAWREAIEFGRSYKRSPEIEALVEKFDVADVARASLALARAVDEASAPGTAPVGSFSFTWRTSIGTIELTGEQNDRHEGGPYLLIIDAGGDDVYRPSGEGIEDCPVAVSIDLAGNDRYEGPNLAFGVGVTGIGFLVDLSGDDRYEAEDVGPGSACFGVGVVLDRAGNDVSYGHVFGQGAATCGIGIHADLAGDDRYTALQMSQGYGGHRGIGALVDLSGRDHYVARDDKIERPSPQTAMHNTSLSQGCGFGRRAHPGDGWSLAGGIGVLADGDGDDVYTCGLFGQGAGYWYALGILVDEGGDDSYDGVWYVQGSAAHYAVGALVDVAGNDRYLGRIQANQGSGNDSSIGVLVDLAGDDRYDAGNLSLGSGIWNGIGLFRDDGGRDVIVARVPSCMGHTEGVAPACTVTGLFLARGEVTFAGPRPGPESREGGVVRLRKAR